jgi:predicted RNA methylase
MKPDFYSYLDTSEYREELSQYYTPEDIAAKMVSLFKHGGTFLDPCCGTGVLSYYLCRQFENPKQFIEQNLIVNDLDKTSLTILQEIFLAEFGAVPRTFNENFLTYKFPSYDYIIMNPPYGKVDPNPNFLTAKTKDVYAYFLEKACAAQGFISINPISFTNGLQFKPLRKLLLDTYSHIDVYNFDNIPGHIFSDAKTRASIIVADNSSQQRRTTTMLRWGQTERQTLLQNLETYLSPAAFTEDIFYKNTSETLSLLNNKNILANYLSPTPTAYPLYITSAPRYFITAASTKLDRKGQTEIFFKDEISYKKAYIQLNSSYLYWWWRTCDSNMTLTKGTLTTLPFLDIAVNEDLIAALRQSEIDNKVYKSNAGSV